MMRRSLILLALAACIDTPPLAEPVVESSHIEIKEAGEAPPVKLDVLIFVDDTAASAVYREHILSMPGMLAASLDSLAGGWRDLRIAVTTNDGRLRELAHTESSMLIDARDFDYMRWKNYSGSLASALTPLMDVGSAFEGPSQPLEAIRRALESRSSFLRDDAELAIVMITASDDASPWPVADYAHWMQAATGAPWHRRLVIVSVQPKPATRLDAYLGQTLGQGAIVAIDDGDYAEAFGTLHRVDGGRGWSSSVTSCFDTAPMLVADRFDCNMSITIDDELRHLPQCTPPPITDRSDVAAADNGPSPACWSLERDPISCWQNGYGLRMIGYSLSHHPAFRLECRTR